DETSAAPLGQEVVEVPEAGFQLGLDRHHSEAEVLDEVAVDRDEAGTPLGPQRSGYAGGAPAPVIAGQDGAWNAQRIQQRDHVGSEGCLLPRARGSEVLEAGGSMPAQVGDNDPMAGLDQAGDHLNVAMDVVGEPVKQKHD